MKRYIDNQKKNWIPAFAGMTFNKGYRFRYSNLYLNIYRMFGLMVLILLPGLTGLTETGWAQTPGNIVTVATNLFAPWGVYVDGTGNVYIADTGNHRIRKVDAATGIMTTIAGNGTSGFSGDDGPAILAGLNFPIGVYVDGTGNVYIADTDNHRIRKVDAVTGIITTVAGDGWTDDEFPVGRFFGDGGQATAASLDFPYGVFVDGDGNIYIADTRNQRIRKVDAATGIITTVAGDGFAEAGLGRFTGDGGPAVATSLSSPSGVFVDGDGNIYIADNGNHRIRKVDAVTGIITTIAGDGFTDADGLGRFAGDGGQATEASLNFPYGVFVDRTGNAYIADTRNHRIRKVDSGGIITTIAGDGFLTDAEDPRFGRFAGDGGPATAASLSAPSGVYVDGTGNVYIADTDNHRIRKIIADILRFAEGFGRPGGQAIVNVILNTYHAVSGLQFKVQPAVDSTPTILAQFDSVSNNLSGADFAVRDTTDGDGVTTVVQYNFTNVTTVPLGQQTVLRLYYDIDQAASLDTTIHLDVTHNILSDPNGDAILHALEEGMIHVMLPGDVDQDGEVTILDVVKLIRIILEVSPLPEPGSYRYFAMDMNGDGNFDITDVVAMVNAILGVTKPIADGPTTPVAVSLGEVQPLASGQLAIPVMMQADGAIAGAQAVFTFDPAHLTVGTPQLTGRADGMTLMSQVTGGALKVIIYSATGQSIPAGRGTTLLVPVTVSGGASEAPALTLSQVILANRQAHAIPVTLGTNTVKVQSLPAAFALKSNRPNPFNPTTQIAYEVPQAAHITLTVYNLLGQEVVRLVDEQKAPGRYVVTWSGRNARGLGVASGVYLYRLTSSTGFIQSRRMTLVK